MKKTALILSLIAITFSAHAETTEKEKACINETIQLREAIKNGSDSVLNGFINLIPEYKHQLEMLVEDSYHYSLAEYNRK